MTIGEVVEYLRDRVRPDWLWEVGLPPTECAISLQVLLPVVHPGGRRDFIGGGICVSMRDIKAMRGDNTDLLDLKIQTLARGIMRYCVEKDCWLDG